MLHQMWLPDQELLLLSFFPQSAHLLVRVCKLWRFEPEQPPRAKGRNWVERADGTVVAMTGTDKCQVGPGDVFVVETPGGGGYGEPAAMREAAE